MSSGAPALREPWASLLRCVNCNVALSLDRATDHAVTCGACGAVFSVSEGIVKFAPTHDFYEREGFTSVGGDFGDSTTGRLKLYYARQHYLQEITGALPADSRVVEIGSGGGSRYLARRYDVLAVDLASHSSRTAATTYGAAVQASCVQMPLQDRCVDGIVSSFVLEHLEGEDFDRFFGEMRRVLRPGGVMVHYFDVANDAPFTKWAEQQAWYRSLFITERGHHCLRTRDEWRSAFSAAGFSLIRERARVKTWAQDLSILARFDHEEVRGPLRGLGRIARRISKSANRVADATWTTALDVVEPSLPDSWASKVIWVLRLSEES